MDMKIVAHAKDYIDDLARGINPLTKTEVKEDDVINQVRISRCLFYVSDILEEVLKNGGVRMVVEQTPFDPAQLDRALLVPDSQTLPVSMLVERINEVKPTEMKKLKITAVTGWLAAHDFLRTETVNSKARKRPTAQGFEIGITEREKVNDFGVKYYSVLYTTPAQQFVFDHLSAIIEEGFNR